MFVKKNMKFSIRTLFALSIGSSLLFLVIYNSFLLPSDVRALLRKIDNLPPTAEREELLTLLGLVDVIPKSENLSESVDLPLYESRVVADAYKVTVFYGISSDDNFFYNSIFVLGPNGDCLKVKSYADKNKVPRTVSEIDTVKTEPVGSKKSSDDLGVKN